VTCEIKTGTSEQFEFSHAYVNGTVWLYQRVPLSKRKRNLRKTVHDSAWMLEKAIGAGIVNRDRSGALLYVPDEQKGEPLIDEAIRVLDSVTRVLNLRDYERVRREFARL
jgi:hypothetical protein